MDLLMMFLCFRVAVVAIKKSIQPKYRLPILNWVAMKPMEAKGTMFSEIDDEKLYKVLTSSLSGS